MSMGDQLQSARQALLAISGEEALHGFCEQQCRALGFEYFVYALRLPTHFAESRLELINGYPAGWTQRYFEQGYQACDPVLGHCVQGVTPLLWHELQLPPGSAAQQMMADAAAHGLKTGISVPVHGAQGELGVFSLVLNRARDASTDALLRAAQPYVQGVAVYLHQALLRISSLSGPQEHPPLSPREIDCLRWAADGKTSWEIGQLLEMSERTVNFHLNNAIHKLSVSNRQQAVARAAFQRLIKPQPF